MFPFINLNGRIVTANHPHFFSGNRSLKYGDGLFETMQLRNGEILFFQDHLTRLFDGMDAIGLAKKSDFTSTSAYFYKVIYDLLIANKIQSNVIIRLQLFRKADGFYEPSGDEYEFFIELFTVPKDSFTWTEKRITTGIYKEWKKGFNPAMNFKTSNSLLYVMAARWKRDKKLDDALILNDRENICDATSSNVFYIKDRKVFTPPLSDGGIRGVIRKNLIELINQLPANIIESVEERTVTEDELLQSDEIFLTNSSLGIRSVEKIGEKNFSSTLTEKIAFEFYKSLEK